MRSALRIIASREERERRAPGHATAEARQGRWEVFDHRCYVCGAPADALDHVKPLMVGGSNWPSNLRPICTTHNSRKRDRWLGIASLKELLAEVRDMNP